MVFSSFTNGSVSTDPLAAEQDYWAEHPDIYVTDGTQVYRYAVFAAWEPEVYPRRGW